MQTSDLIAILALIIALVSVFVAVFSAWYAMRSARAVRRSNEIALHNERLKILRGVLDLRFELSVHGVNIKKDALSSFYEQMQLSEFYFDRQIYNTAKECYDCVSDMVDFRDIGEHAGRDGREAKQDMDKQTDTIFNQSRNKIATLETMVKAYLRIGES